MLTAGVFRNPAGRPYLQISDGLAEYTAVVGYNELGQGMSYNTTLAISAETATARGTPFSWMDQYDMSGDWTDPDSDDYFT